MTTVPTKPQFSDFGFYLWNLSTGASVARLDPDSIISFKGRTVPGVGCDRLESASFEIPFRSSAHDLIDFEAMQLLQIRRFGDASWDLWGIVSKVKDGYTKEAPRDSLKVQILPIEKLLEAPECYWCDAGEVKMLAYENIYPDDFAKWVIRTVWGPGAETKDGISREFSWGTLVVEADAGECLEQKDLRISLNGKVGPAIDSISRTYDFDYQLVPSVSAGAWTFTFKTQAPYGGDDLTSGASRIHIRDLGLLIPSASHYRETFGLVNAPHTRGYQKSTEAAVSVGVWGRWEGVIEGETDSDLEIAIEEGRVKEGSEWDFEAYALNGYARWLGMFKAGDMVLRSNTRLNIERESAKIKAVEFSFPNKALFLVIEYGDREPGLTDTLKGGKWRPPYDEIIYPAYHPPVSVGAANVEGEGLGMVREDHVHRGVIIDDGSNEVAPVDGAWTFLSSDDTILIDQTGTPGQLNLRGDPGALGQLIDHDDLLNVTADQHHTGYIGNQGNTGAGATPDGNYEITFLGDGDTYNFDAHDNQVDFTGPWTRVDAGSADYYLRQTNYADDIRLQSAADTDEIWLEGDTGKSHFGDDMYIGNAAGVEDVRLTIHDVRAFSGLHAHNGATGYSKFGTISSGITVIDNEAGASISFQCGGVESLHLHGDLEWASFRNGVSVLGSPNSDGSGAVWTINSDTGNLYLDEDATTTLGAYVLTWPKTGAAESYALTIASVSGSAIGLAWSEAASSITIVEGPTGHVTQDGDEYTIDSNAYVGTAVPASPWQGMLRVATGI